MKNVVGIRPSGVGGDFGDDAAADRYRIGGMPDNAARNLDNYLGRINDGSTDGSYVPFNGLPFDIYYQQYDDGSLQTDFSISINAHVVTKYWHQDGVFGHIGDFATRAANNLTFGFVDYVNRSRGMDDAEINRQYDSKAGQFGEDTGMVLGIMLPGPGKFEAIEGTLVKLGIELSEGTSDGIKIGTGGRNSAVRLFNELRGANPRIRNKAGHYLADSINGGKVGLRFPAASRSRMWTVDIQQVGGKIHF